MTEYFISTRIIDGKPTEVIADDNGKVINRNPTKEELKGLKTGYNKVKRQKYTRHQLSEFLRKYKREEERVPEQLDFNNNPRYPSFSVYIREFGSWNNAVAMAGLQNNCFYIENEELLGALLTYSTEYGRPPTYRDLTNNPKYPSAKVYQDRFGTLENAKKLVGLDIDSIVEYGIIETNDQKRRLSEILIREHFDDVEMVVDLSGENCNSPYDGICPKGQTYDVKSSALDIDHYDFKIYNSYKDEIEWYYLLGFNKDYAELQYVWRIPTWEFIEYIEKGRISIGSNNNREYNIENMKQYEITKKVMSIFKNWLVKIQASKEKIVLHNTRGQYNKRMYDECIAKEF